MASSRKPRSGDSAGAAVESFLDSLDLRAKRVAVGLSGGLDSVVLLHLLKASSKKHRFRLQAIHVNHGLSPHARGWENFCRTLCKRLGIALAVRRVAVVRQGRGLEAAAREARYRVFRESACDAVMLAHHLDDQAETVLMNLLRGAGARGASGMPVSSRLGEKLLLRPLLEVRREAVIAHAREHKLDWIDDESNTDESLTRNFIRHRVGPLLEARFPKWRESLARAARLFSKRELDAQRLLREFLSAQGLKAPSEAKLVEMLKQLTGGGARAQLEHDGARLRVYRGKLSVAPATAPPPFASLRWRGERRLPIPALGGELRFRRVRGDGIDCALLEKKSCTVRLRAGGERLQPDARRPRRTLKNLFQEAAVPPWKRDRLPLLFCGADLAWAPGLGIDVRFQAAPQSEGVVPEWQTAA